MEYYKTVFLKDGTPCLLRSASAADGDAVYAVFNQTHAETDYLLSYPEENSFTPEEESRFLEEKKNSPREIEILALVDGVIAGTAGIEAVGGKEKVRHRATFGISVLREFWGRGIGRALTAACIECAADAGYAQLELEAVAENARALSLYRSMGFVEYGRNPLGFRSRVSGPQALVLMRLALDDEKTEQFILTEEI